MDIFRVYKAYHAADESGTREFGYFSTLEKAKERLREIWNQRNYPEPKLEDKTAHGWFFWCGRDFIGICIMKITIDKNMDINCNGYT